MERRAFVLALALTLPLALYGIPYAYAVSTQSTYVRALQDQLSPGAAVNEFVLCSNPSDYTQHFTVGTPNAHSHFFFEGTLLTSSVAVAQNGDNPNGWRVGVRNDESLAVDFVVQIVCQSPITLPAGLGVPEFGSLYVAIALGAVAYFLLARRFGRKPTAPVQIRSSQLD